MVHEPTLRGIFLTSEAPAEVARFYRDVAGIGLEQVGADTGHSYWRIDLGEMQIALHGAAAFAERTAFWPQGRRAG